MFIKNHGSAWKRNAKKEQKAVKNSMLDNAEFLGALASSDDDTNDMVAQLMEQAAAQEEDIAALKEELAALKK